MSGMTTPLTILLVGPTASGKSSLALRLTEATGGLIVNADALQVYECWRILTARPSPDDEARADHALYGHVERTATYSVGHWLRDLQELLSENLTRPRIIVGGTGLYFTALTQGLAEIPETAAEIRAEGDRIRLAGGAAALIEDLQTLDPEILEAIDKNNPLRLQRAWEVARSTGKPLSAWQKETSEPLLPESACLCLTISPPRERLRQRIDARFDWMMANGAVAECEAVLDSGWNPEIPSARALGAAEIIASLKGEMTLEEAVESAKIATRQYAKRQRTWLRSKMGHWQAVSADTSVENLLK